MRSSKKALDDHLGVADAGLVGDVELAAAAGGGVLPLGPAGLHAEGVAVRLELVHAPGLVELRQLEHDARAQAGAKVGRAGADVAQVFVVPVTRKEVGGERAGGPQV